MQRLERLYINIPALKPGSLGAYGLAVGATAIATGVRLAIEPYVSGVQFITFFPATIIVTLVSGVRAGFLSAALGAAAAWYLIMPSHAVTTMNVVTTLLFFLVASAQVLLIGALRFAIQKYRELNQGLERRVDERTSELLKTQQRLVQAQKMEAVGQLTGGLSHDFNNMIAVVVGNLELLKRRLEAGQTDVLKFVDNAMSGAQSAARLTQRLLAFARNQPLAPADVDINHLVSGISELLRRTLGETVQTECVLSGGLWRAKVDPNQLESAIVNLAVNARDAMPEGGALTIETANAYLDDHYAARNTDVTAGQYVLIAVTDTGMGMTPDVAARAIDPFFTTKGPGKGTGLGLSQVYGFVKQSGGHLAIYTEETRGTTVRIYLPRAYGAAGNGLKDTAEPDAQRPYAQKSEVILVVEDEEHVRRMSIAALEELGYRTLEAASGQDALMLLEKEPSIALLFTDIVMPMLDGRKLADAARLRRPNLKVLYTTGYTRNAIVHGGTVDADAALIIKPFTLDQLARKVRSVLEAHDGDVLPPAHDIT